MGFFLGRALGLFAFNSNPYNLSNLRISLNPFLSIRYYPSPPITIPSHPIP